MQLYPISPITMSVKTALRIINEFDLRGKDVLTIQPPATKFFWDHGDTTYLCGKCKVVLAEDVDKIVKPDKVLKCNKCGSYNTV